MTHSLPLLPYCPSGLADRLLSGGPRILLCGETGIGKSTLTAALARIMTTQDLTCFGIAADPGSPGFGLPGTVSLGQWREPGWQTLAFEALCTLDAGRFRLPLITAVSRLIRQAPAGLLLIDTPGVVRGIAGSELLTGLATLLDIDTVLMLARQSKPVPLQNELLALPARVLAVHSHPEARRPGKKARARKRTERWRAYLEATHEATLDLSGIRLTGAPPPIDVPDAWPGRQCAVIDAGRTMAIGEIISLQDRRLSVRLPEESVTTDALLLRDARTEKNGLLGSAEPFASNALQYLPPTDALPYPTATYSGGPRPVAKLIGAYAVLVNGVFDDPLLHLRLRQQQRSLLFDLGDFGRLPARIAHQVSDVFISHAHIDHIGGFLWLLRSRVGDFAACRLFGPPGLSGHVQGLISGFLWDRIGDTGPRFEIAEVHGDRLRRTRIQAGGGREDLPEIRAADGLLLDDPQFSVRTITLDHGTPVQAYAFESKARLNVDQTKLAALGLSAGPWLNRLKQRLAEGDQEALIELPDKTRRRAAELGAQLVTVTPGEKLVYATDLANTAANRSALTALAQKADFLFCEAAFLEADSEQSRRTGHLTARACGEIATAADVRQLVPFHFSRRYETNPEAVYLEITAVCSRVVVPPKDSLQNRRKPA
ncbi:MAG: MBL fold metallo-hydrolase [Methylobacter sp.]|uniref:Clp1/GlmU family protein n=1 Tax=Methylobacter sp. TaxID=2051955 RepID=UPI00258F844C|nr:Clp1/GlmU family protein [Methylobacter sp.]MCL7419419.1 MBL fold metallo-hydrolase [Methylobacter sp.]